MRNLPTGARRNSGARRCAGFVVAAAACVMAFATAPLVDPGPSMTATGAVAPTRGDAVAVARHTADVVARRAVAGVRPTTVTHRIEMRGFQFVPADVRIAPGDRVVWINADPVPHTATATDDSWDTGGVAPGDSVVLSAPTAATYICTFHPSMTGTIALDEGRDGERRGTRDRSGRSPRP